MTDLPELPPVPEDLPENLKTPFEEMRTRLTGIAVKMALLEYRVSEYKHTIEQQNQKIKDYERQAGQCPKCFASSTPKSPSSWTTPDGPL